MLIQGKHLKWADVLMGLIKSPLKHQLYGPMENITIWGPSYHWAGILMIWQKFGPNQVSAFRNTLSPYKSRPSPNTGSLARVETLGSPAAETMVSVRELPLLKAGEKWRRLYWLEAHWSWSFLSVARPDEASCILSSTDSCSWYLCWYVAVVMHSIWFCSLSSVTWRLEGWLWWITGKSMGDLL